MEIEKLVYGGAGLSRAGGRVTLAPFVLPGETVRVGIEEEKRDLARARLLEVLRPAAARVEPRCPFFTFCGGCHYQHAAYEYQLEAKQAILREALRRVGKVEAPGQITVVSGPAWEYRNRAQFHIVRGRIGFLEAGSRRLCPVDRCPISSPRLNVSLAALSDMLRDSRFPRFVRSIELFTNENEVQVNILETGRGVAYHFFDWCAERIPGALEGALEYTVGADRFRVSHGTFFQVNRFLLERLVEEALATAEGETALDLYAGAGLFTLALARRFRTVTAVETGLGALGDLEFNAGRAGLVVAGKRAAAEAFLDQLDRAPDFVLADPPRAGLGQRAVRRLAELKPARLTIVACDPATLARDLAGLLAAGYTIERLALVDLFPQTYHLETVAHLSSSRAA